MKNFPIASLTFLRYLQILLSLLLFCFFLVEARGYSSGPPAGRTGAPEEKACNECHSSFPLNRGSGQLKIIAPTTYQPGQTYRIKVTLQQIGQSAWGFEATVKRQGTNQRGGEIRLIDEARTQFAFDSPRGSQDPQYITHTFQGAFFRTRDGPVSWEFDWVAPPAGTGTVVFYVAGNAANGDGSSLGDYIYTASAQVTEAPQVALSLHPTQATIRAGASLVLQASLQGTEVSTLQWTLLSGPGTLEPSGVTATFKAPSQVSAPVDTIIRVNSSVAPEVSSTAIVRILPPLTVSVSPTSVKLHPGETVGFTALVENSLASQEVTWQVQGIPGGNAEVGVISSSGVYTAPLSSQKATFLVEAVSKEDPLVKGSAQVTVIPKIGITISPSSVQLRRGQRVSFQVSITGTSNQGVLWRLTGPGTLMDTGQYIAPARIDEPQKAEVQAISQEDPSVSVRAQVDLLPDIILTLEPSQVKVPLGGQQRFQVSFKNAVTKEFLFRIEPANGGVITETGLYTAPNTFPSSRFVTLTAVSKEDPQAQAVALIELFDDTPPEVQWKQPSVNSFVKGTTPLEVEAHDNIALKEVRLFLDAKPLAFLTTTPFVYSWDTRSVADGPHTLSAQARDEEGNFSALASLQVIVDNTPPQVRWMTPQDKEVLRGTVKLEWTSEDNQRLAREVLSIDDKVLVENPKQRSFRLDTGVFSEGNHRLVVQVVDGAGNSAEAVITLTVDNTPPSIQILAPESRSIVGGKVTIRLKVTESNPGSARLEYGLGIRPQTWFLIAQPRQTGQEESFVWDASPLEDNLYLLRVIARDSAGNEAFTVVFLTVDNTPPSVRISSPQPKSLLKNRVRVFGSVKDDHLKEWRLEYGEGADPDTFFPIASSSEVTEGLLGVWDARSLTPGIYTLRLVAIDGAGQTVQTLLLVQILRAGDLNGDLRVTVADAVLALRFMLGLEKPAEGQRVAADLSPEEGDGQITIGDIVLLLRMALGLQR